MWPTIKPLSQNWDITPESLTPLSIKVWVSVIRLLAPNCGIGLLLMGATYR